MTVRIASCKVITTPETSLILADTSRVFSECCNFLSAVAWREKTFNIVKFHHAAYYSARSRFPALPSRLVVLALTHVCNSYKADKTRQHSFRPFVSYDTESHAVRDNVARLHTVHGRQNVELAIGAHQQRTISGGRIGNAFLCYRNSTWFLEICVHTSTPKRLQIVNGALGVDLGIANIATDSDGQHFSGTVVQRKRKKLLSCRRNLQKCGSRNAKRHLRKLRFKEKRFSRDVNHCIAKQLVHKCVSQSKALGLENLKGIRERANGFGREFRRILGSWAFYDLRAKIAYKAEDAGIPVVFVDPRNTSRTCSRCGHCAPDNRKSQSHFLCQMCGFDAHADVNAAVNIGARAVAELPIASSS